MFKLENTKKLKSALLGIGLSTFLASSALASSKEMSVDGAVKYPIKDGKYTSYYLNIQEIKDFNIGRTPTKREITAWDVDAKPDGTGLPQFDMKNGEVVLGDDGKPKKAEGSVELGNELYDAQCVMCHGDFGTGGKGYPRLAGGTKESLKIQRLNPADEHPNPDTPIRTIGSYWPYASTLYWYVQDSMPFNHPKSLTNSETYALTAYLLSINGITYEGVELDDEFVLDKEKLMKIVMPNHDGFYPEVDTKDPKQGVKNMTALLSDPKIYGTGTRCMKDCIKEDIQNLLMKVNIDLTANSNQPMSVVRSLPKVENKVSLSFGQKTYEESCVTCHGNPALGAPVLGDKEAWKKVTAKGVEKVYHNGINGINSMPPKGGTDLNDEQIKEVIDYMINSSK
ncbi:sulfur oxidation protein SoxCD [Arcobacter suis]|uniref:Sulfur oxidation protein SoxCD, diheme cytochrome c subunit n=1 Tax=Arcobacter suis CECT 7833 TaxID=663365 RepID=A0AAD0WPY1_9BACT|nr:c-type cytochrome [Arcobacter suis]AXX89159.1 sulfur oxidation protein SoxCD, diheme cytochrome c subunit [Arcobacter suis CECT 7833]RWS47840.1 sulfur oxidation protein SoxCD [Arcobacter suis]